MGIRMSSFLYGALAMLLVLIVAGLIVVFTGGYDIAASASDSPMAQWVLNGTFESAVRREGRGIKRPGDFTAAMIAAGAGEYKGMCQHCHGGIGVKPDEWATGMHPRPPDLTGKDAGELSPAEVFWLVKHGVRMTGMPAFGSTHDDATIWNIAAFVKALPRMTSAQYAAYKTEHEEQKGG